MKHPVGVVGLGIMGSAMAASLVRSGFRVHGYDVLAERRAALKKIGGFPCKSVAEVASKAKIIITSLPSADALHKASRQLKGIVVETSTLPIADKSKARDVLQRKKAILLDCPLSGTGAQARSGDLVVYGSGDKAAFSKVIPVLKGFSRAQYFVGEFGNGSKMKFVANLMVAIHNVSAAGPCRSARKPAWPRNHFKVAGRRRHFAHFQYAPDDGRRRLPRRPP